MDFLRRSCPFAAWLAALAVLLGALAPAAAQVVAGARGQGDWVQICSASGVAWVRLSDAAAERSSSNSDNGKTHCSWCLLGDGAALPPQPSTFNGEVHRADVLSLGVGDPVLQAPWPSALSRAPPRA